MKKKTNRKKQIVYPKDWPAYLKAFCKAFKLDPASIKYELNTPVSITPRGYPLPPIIENTGEVELKIYGRTR